MSQAIHCKCSMSKVKFTVQTAKQCISSKNAIWQWIRSAILNLAWRRNYVRKDWHEARAASSCNAFSTATFSSIVIMKLNKFTLFCITNNKTHL